MQISVLYFCSPKHAKKKKNVNQSSKNDEFDLQHFAPEFSTTLETLSVGNKEVCGIIRYKCLCFITVLTFLD